MAGYADDQIKSKVEESDSNEFEGRFQRLKFLISLEPEGYMSVSALASAYYDETKICWYNGAFIATVVMAQVALEELIRSHYRAAGYSKKSKSAKSIDSATFSELIDEALSDEYITEEEARKLHEVRKYSDAYTHVKEAKIKDGKQDLKSPSFITQDRKIHAPALVGVGVEDEAKVSIEIMVKLFQSICNRTGGL